MVVLYIILFIMPGFISACNYMNINKIDAQRKWYFVSIYSIVIVIADCVLLYFRGWCEFAFERLSVQFLLKALPCNLVIAYIIPYVVKMLDYILGRFITGKYKPKH